MQIKTLIATTAFMTLSAYGSCTYRADTANVSWKAFKTYEKIGVSGAFNRVNFSPHSDTSVEALLMGSKVTIDTATVNSGNSGRDATLVQSFFKVQHLNTLTATVVGVKDAKALVALTLNGITRTIPFPYQIQGEKIIAKGVMDLGDFSLLPSLQSLNKACFDLHGGKTWQEVEIGFEIPFTSTCTQNSKEK